MLLGAVLGGGRFPGTGFVRDVRRIAPDTFQPSWRVRGIQYPSLGGQDYFPLAGQDGWHILGLS